MFLAAFYDLIIHLSYCTLQKSTNLTLKNVILLTLAANHNNNKLTEWNIILIISDESCFFLVAMHHKDEYANCYQTRQFTQETVTTVIRGTALIKYLLLFYHLSTKNQVLGAALLT